MKYESLDLMFGRHDVTRYVDSRPRLLQCADIMAALRQRLEHHCAELFNAPDSYLAGYNRLAVKSRHGRLTIDRDELSFVPGVVKGIVAINYFTSRGDKVG